MLQVEPRLGTSLETAKTKTLADVIAAVDLIENLSPGRRGDLKTACRRIAKVLGRAPEGIPLDLATLREMLADIQPVRHDMTAKRWSTIRSDFLGALRLTGLAESVRTSKAVLSPKWAAILESTQFNHYRTHLSRFARYCSQENIEPTQVNDQVLEQFATALTTATLVRKPGYIIRNTARCWNAVRQTQQVGEALTVQSNRLPPTRISLASLPTSFVVDLANWRDSLEAKDPFADDARNKPLRSVTVNGYMDKILSAVTAAVAGGVDPNTVISLARLVEPEVFTVILRHRHTMDKGRPGSQTQGIATILLIVAKKWCKAPQEQIDKLKKLRAKLPPLRPGMTDKNRRLLNDFEDPKLLQQFLTIPARLWRKATDPRLPAHRRLVAAQLSLLFDIITVVPLRLKNLASLSFDGHLSWPRGAKGPALLFLSGEEMKNGEDYQAELPADVARRLLLYRQQFAPPIVGFEPASLL